MIPGRIENATRTAVGTGQSELGSRTWSSVTKRYALPVPGIRSMLEVVEGPRYSNDL